MPPATEHEFLDAIRRDPTDHAAVHVYADWLVDRGDARGELIALQAREPELDRDGLERLLELASRFGFLRIPDDPERDVLRFAGGATSDPDALVVLYVLIHGGHSYRVLESAGQLHVERDRDAHRVGNSRGMIRPEVANVVLATVSEAIVLDEPLDKLALPDALDTHPHYRIGRFPTEPIPASLSSRWAGAKTWHIDFRDLQRWRQLAARWQAMR